MKQKLELGLTVTALVTAVSGLVLLEVYQRNANTVAGIWCIIFLLLTIGLVLPIILPIRKCKHDPRTMAGKPIGMYHCPGCGVMQIAGRKHISQADMDIAEDRMQAEIDGDKQAAEQAAIEAAKEPKRGSCAICGEVEIEGHPHPQCYKIK